jgi:diguanylate cyclase (GGDEF)-like protein
MAKERQELEQRADALTDALTGLPNRRALFEAADSLTPRNGSGGPISVLLFDLDHFEKINDTFGHEAGDRVLKLFAATVSEHLNGGTIVARLGGEEFAAIMLKTDLAAAALAAEVVRRAFAKSAAVVDGLAVDGTVSVGAASDMHVGGDLSALFRRADAALYTAKRAGRNRVELLETDDARIFSGATTSVRSSRRKTSSPIVGPRSIKVGT